MLLYGWKMEKGTISQGTQWEKASKWTLSLTPQRLYREHSLTNTLVSAHWNQCQTSGLQNGRQYIFVALSHQVCDQFLQQQQENKGSYKRRVWSDLNFGMITSLYSLLWERIREGNRGKETNWEACPREAGSGDGVTGSNEFKEVEKKVMLHQ